MLNSPVNDPIKEYSFLIIGFHRKCRDRISIEHFIEHFTLTALCQKEFEEDMENLRAMGKESQAQEFIKICKELTKTISHEWVASLHFSKDAQVIGESIELLSKLKLTDNLAASIRKALEISNINKDAISTESEAYLFKSLIKNSEKKTIAFPAAGMATTASQLEAQEYQLQEVNHAIYALSAACLYLERKEVNFYCSNSLQDASFIAHKADIVITVPPMGYKLTQANAHLGFPTLVQGSVPTSGGDSLWIQLTLACQNDTGKGYIMLPSSCLSRGGYDAQVRECLLNHDLVEAVIALPPKLLAFTAIAPSLLIMNKARPKGAPIHFIDATEIGRQERKQTILSKADCELIYQLVQGNEPNDPRFTAKTLPEIRKISGNKGNILSVSQFIKKSVTIQRLDLSEEQGKLQKAHEEFSIAQQHLTSVLNKI